MAKKDSNADLAKKVGPGLNRLNNLFNDLKNSMSSGSSTDRSDQLDSLNKQVDDIIYDEIETITKYTGDDISTFLTKTFNERDALSTLSNKTIENIFEDENYGLFSFFQDRYRNQNLLYEDLNTITMQLFEIKEALFASRDAIVSADDVSSGISRQISFSSKSDKADQDSLNGIVESMEKKFKLTQKIKNHIITNTLEFGRYYVYTVPYSKLFKKYYDKKTNSKMNIPGRPSTSSVSESSEIALENLTPEAAAEFKKELNAGDSPKSISEKFNKYLSDISVINDDPCIPLLEADESGISALIDKKLEEQRKKINKAAKNKSSIDGTVDPNSTEADFSSVKDCYMQLIDPRKIIPIKILNETIGYYYIHETQLRASKSPFTSSIKTVQGENAGIENTFLTKITDKIVKAFDKKYLENNAKFKDIILNALMYNDIYKKELKFQFIPVDYITEFTVNENENGEGTSILLSSLFYAKLYLALLIFKMISIISKSNDQKIYYIRNSGIDNNVANKVQDVARSIKAGQINFMDLMDSKTMVSKVGKAKDIFMPVGRSGERAIDFDIMQGQEVQMNTELMELLRTSFINATGVPSVIMNYVNEADYAKSLVMANEKFLARVVGYQMDFNTPLTELYKKLMRFSTEIDPDIIDSFVYSLYTPKTLNALNMADLIGNADQLVQYLVKVSIGENHTPTDDENLLKDILYRKFSKEIAMQMLPWTDIVKIKEDAELELKQIKERQKASASGTDDANGSGAAPF